MKKLVFLLLCLVSFSVAAQDYLNPALPVETRVNDLLSRMTLLEKIGQMVQAEKTATVTGDLATYGIGSLLRGGGSLPSPNTITGWADEYDAVQTDALNSRLKIPVIFGVDAVHGFGNCTGTTVFPHNIGLGAARDAALMLEIGTIVAKEVAASGIDWTFAPCVAVARNERWGRTYESFGEDPQVHDLLVANYVQGFQGTSLSDGEHILSCVKHYIGDGGTTDGIDQGDTVCTETVLRALHLPPYQKAIAAGAASIMVSFSSWNGVKCHEHTQLLTTILKNELGFSGFVISDWNGTQQLSGTSADQARKAVNAGIDMLMLPDDWKAFITDMQSLVNSGLVTQARIDDAVKRILTVKFKLGLFENPKSDRSIINSGYVGSSANRDVARKAVRESMVLLKNDGVLPLSKNISSVIVAGKNANNLGYQCGGWTIEWQGASGNITTGTTIYTGITQTVSSSTSVTYSLTGTGATGKSVAIAVIGETPYAEGYGDDADLSLSSEDITCLNNLQAAGIPIVVVLVSGRPLLISNYINNWNAVVAAWLPGTEGRGVAEVLFGDYDFTGKLPCSWPSSMSQVPVNVGDSTYNPQFAFGYGLTYSGTTPAPTDPPSDTIVPTSAPETPAPTDVPTATPAPTVTPGPTSVPTATPVGVTIEPTAQPADTIAPTADPTAPPDATALNTPVPDTPAPTDPPVTTAAPTSPPGADCTCTNLCTSQTAITVPFTKDGTGEYCYTASSLGSYVNSWNTDAVNINGTTCTNTYVTSSSIAAINGVYYIYYKGSYSWSHLEIK